jgi:hypothetical protein
MTTVYLYSLLFFSAIVHVQGQIVWSLTPQQHAATSAKSAILMNKGPLQSTQFLYQRNDTNSTSVPLVQVILKNYESGNETKIDQGFDAITQACSCYWMDVNQLFGKFPSLKSSLQYRLIFRSMEPTTRPFEAASG